MALNNLIQLPVHRRVGELGRHGTIDPTNETRDRDIVHGLKNDICCLLLGIGGLKASSTCTESLKRRLDLLEQTLLQVNGRVDELAALSSKKAKTAKPDLRVTKATSIRPKSGCTLTSDGFIDECNDDCFRL